MANHGLFWEQFEAAEGFADALEYAEHYAGSLRREAVHHDEEWAACLNAGALALTALAVSYKNRAAG